MLESLSIRRGGGVASSPSAAGAFEDPAGTSVGMAGSFEGGERGSVAAASKAGVVGEMDSPIFLVDSRPNCRMWKCHRRTAMWVREVYEGFVGCSEVEELRSCGPIEIC